MNPIKKVDEIIGGLEVEVTLEGNRVLISKKTTSLWIIVEVVSQEDLFREEDTKVEDLLELGFNHKERLT